MWTKLDTALLLLESQPKDGTKQVVLCAFRLLLRNADSISSLECDADGVKAGFCSQGNSWKRLMCLLMQLRKVTDHPFLLPNSEPHGDASSTLEELVEASGAGRYIFQEPFTGAACVTLSYPNLLTCQVSVAALLVMACQHVEPGHADPL